jgi:hypothetical protein
MPHRGRAQAAPPGTKGFDCNQNVAGSEAENFFKLGYRFACRYVPRHEPARPFDLNFKEIVLLFNAGLGVMAVQHVESETNWTPTITKGIEMGRTAARYCDNLSYGQHCMIWLDLEGVDPIIPAGQITKFCNAWYTQVEAHGYTPGLYVGWHCGLTPHQLFHRLEFQHYWGAYNLDRDEEPEIRGLQMKQGTVKEKNVPLAPKIRIDTNIVMQDKLGGLPLVFAPEEWSVGQ